LKLLKLLPNNIILYTIILELVDFVEFNELSTYRQNINI